MLIPILHVTNLLLEGLVFELILGNLWRHVNNGVRHLNIEASLLLSLEVLYHQGLLRVDLSELLVFHLEVLDLPLQHHYLHLLMSDFLIILIQRFN